MKTTTYSFGLRTRCLLPSAVMLNVLTIIFVSATWFAKAQSPAEQAHPAEERGLLFTKNEGQWTQPVAFRAGVPGGTVFLEKNGFTYALVNASDIDGIHPPKKEIPAQGLAIRMHALKVSFTGTTGAKSLQGNAAADGYTNYFTGNDASKWKSHVMSYREVVYNRLYEGVDMKVYSVSNTMKYDLLVAPHADAGVIRLQYDGADGMHLENGNLKITTTAGTVTEQKPYAYQYINGKRVTVPCAYVLDANELSFAFPKGYDSRYELVIDPTLIFSTLTGSAGDNWGFTATYDDNGNFYTGGVSLSTGYPFTAGAYQVIWRGGGGGGNNGYPFDATITKYNPTGTTRIYSTYLGGSDNDFPSSFIVNKNEELYVLGRTYSSDFPVTAGAYQSSLGGGGDLFITRFNATGTALIGSTFIGGSGDDGVNISALFGSIYSLKYNYGDDFRSDIYVDANDNVYVASSTQSFNFPVVNGFQNALQGIQDGVVLKMNGALTALQWSSYIGGSGDDAAYAVTLDNTGNVLITGGTASTNFPVTAGVYQTANAGGIDGFIAKIPNAGGSITACTYLGTSDYDQSYLIQSDKSDNIYVAGQTQGAYPVSAGVYSNANSSQFIHKFNSSLTSSAFSTVIGNGNRTGANMSLTAFLVDICGNLYLSGWGRSCLPLGSYPSGNVSGMPVTANAYQSVTNGCNFYFIQLSRDAQTLLYGSYFGDVVSGREHVDGGTSRFDKNGIIYQSVCAACGGIFNGFPTTPGVVSPTNGSSNCNNGSIKMKFDNNFVTAGYTTPNGNAGCAPLSVGFVNTSQLGGNYVWDFGDGNTSAAASPAHVYTVPGTYNVRLIASNATTCNISDTIYGTVTVHPPASVNAGPDVTICNGASANLTATGGAGYTYTWTPATGLSSTSSPTPVASPTATTTYTVLITDQNGCTATDDITVAVGALTASASQNTSICAGSSTQLSASGGTIYTWSPALGLNNPAVSNPTASPSATTTYTVLVSDAGGCSGTATVTVTVNQLPVVTFAALPNVCVNTPAFALSGGAPAGGVYSGAGVSGNLFDPATAGTGTHILAYNYTDNNGCSGSASSNITVDPAGAVTINAIPNMCVTASPVTLSGSPAGGTFSGPGVTGNTFNPALAGAGTHTITYTFTASPCLLNTSASTTVMVSPQPSALIVTPPPSGCAPGSYTGSAVLTAVATPGATSYQWYLNGAPITGATGSSYTATTGGWYNVLIMLNGCQSDSNNTGINIILFDVRCGHDTTKKVLICHVPDCRYDKQVTICIGEPAVPAHFKNHPCDCMGPCPTPHPNKREGEIDYSGIEFSAVPNPFRKDGVIEFFVSDAAHTTLHVYDIRGGLIGKLFDARADENVEYRVNISGLSEGVYIARLESGDFIKHLKLVVTK